MCAGWVRFPSGTDFATLWGGATLPEWRGQGIYRALVAQRTRLAAERGRRYMEVDASDDSRPILERLGFTAGDDHDAVRLVAPSATRVRRRESGTKQEPR